MIAAGQESFPGFDSASSLEGRSRALRREADLFAPPEALIRMNLLLAAAPVDLKRLEEAVKYDPQLVTEALRLCNSSLFHLPHPVSRLEQAVMIMDAEITRALLLVCWVVKQSRLRMGAQDHRAFWAHSLLVAQLSRHLCEWANYGQPECAFVAGLFHDVGALPFLTLFSRNGAGSGANAFEQVGDGVEPQRRRFGVDHCELAHRMGSLLALPSWSIEVATKHHQRGGASSSFPLLCFVSAAEVMAQVSISSGGHPSALPERPAILSALAEYLPGLSSAANSGLIETLESDLRTACTLFVE